MYRLLPGWKVYLRDVAENQLRRRVKSNDGRTTGLEPEEWNESVVAGGEGDDRGWDGWMASPSRWTWVWISSGSWWWAGRPDMLQSMGSQIVRHDWATELNWGKNKKTRVTGSLRTCKSTRVRNSNKVNKLEGSEWSPQIQVSWVMAECAPVSSVTRVKLLLLFSSLVMFDSFATPWTVACQAPLSRGFSRQEYWSGLPFLLRGSSWPRDQTHISCIASGFFTTESPGKLPRSEDLFQILFLS